MARLLLVNGRIWDGERFFFGDVLVEDTKIADIADRINETADIVYDASGKIISAGLVDAHVHMRGISIDAYGVSADLSCIPFGVTSAADAGSEQGNKALLSSHTVKGAAIVPVKVRDNRADFTNTIPMLEKFGDSAVGVKMVFDAVVPALRDTAPLAEACEFAHKRGLSVTVHTTGSPTPMYEVFRTVGRGDIITHSFHGGRNNAADDGFASMKEAMERGVYIDIGFAGHVHTDFKILKAAIDSGIVPDIISTDITKLSCYKRGGIYGMIMCMSIARHLGMTEGDVMRAVTSTPAAALGKEGVWGRLYVGGPADIAVLDESGDGFDLTDAAGNNIKSDKGYRARLTVIDGEIVFRC